MLPPIRSAYRDHPTYGYALQAEVLRLRPKRVIEFGCANGFTTCIIGNCLGPDAHFTSHDTFSHRFSSHWQMAKVQYNIWRYGNHLVTNLCRLNFYKWKPEPFDLMYIDIENDGWVIGYAARLLRFGGTILFEGGSEARDNVPWMRRHKHITQCNIPFTLLDPSFPGLSRIEK